MTNHSERNPGMRRDEDLEPGQTPPESDPVLATAVVAGFLALMFVIAYFAGALG